MENIAFVGDGGIIYHIYIDKILYYSINDRSDSITFCFASSEMLNLRISENRKSIEFLMKGK
ncbi:hypothetical protein ACUNWD_10045 [Sunxiuqinia sp. A32]|uniref:hypothetical protein n=1 Tax=Sunxiuqinia sp. A32 TaxID=3461496 RepID=UPI0040456031